MTVLPNGEPRNAADPLMDADKIVDALETLLTVNAWLQFEAAHRASFGGNHRSEYRCLDLSSMLADGANALDCALSMHFGDEVRAENVPAVYARVKAIVDDLERERQAKRQVRASSGLPVKIRRARKNYPKAGQVALPTLWTDEEVR